MPCPTQLSHVCSILGDQRGIKLSVRLHIGVIYWELWKWTDNLTNCFHPICWYFSGRVTPDWGGAQERNLWGEYRSIPFDKCCNYVAKCNQSFKLNEKTHKLHVKECIKFFSSLMIIFFVDCCFPHFFWNYCSISNYK